MKIITSCLFFVLLLAKTYGQTTDTLIVYDHIIVYDTIKVYDTLVVYDTIKIDDKTFFSQSSFPQNSVLTIDTATNQLNLEIFFQKDTATISINSILLSENTKNSEAMKKEILTIIASAMLSQVNVAQEDKMLPNPVSSQSEINVPLIKDSVQAKKISFGFGVSGNGTLLQMKASSLRDIGLLNLGGNLKFDYLINRKWSVGFKFIFTQFKRLDYYEAFDVSEYYTVKYNPGYSLNSSIVSTYYLLGNNQSGKRSLYITQGLGYGDFNTSDTQFSTKNHYSTDAGVPFGEGTFKHYERIKFSSGLISLGADFALLSGRLYIELPISISIYNERSYNVLTPDGPVSKIDRGFSIYGTSAFINVGYALSF